MLGTVDAGSVEEQGRALPTPTGGREGTAAGSCAATALVGSVVVCMAAVIKATPCLWLLACMDLLLHGQHLCCCSASVSVRCFFVYTSVGLYGAVAVMLTCTAAICGCALYLCAAVPCAV
jgi:hypothetical protein